MQQPVVGRHQRGQYSSTGTGALRFTCCVRVPFIAAWIASRVQAGWFFSSHNASAGGSATRTQPWLKSRRLRANTARAGVPMQVDVGVVGEDERARPSEFFARPLAHARRAAVRAGNHLHVVACG